MTETHAKTTRTLADYRPQHDAGCRWKIVATITHDRTTYEPCTCGLDTLLAQPPPTTEPQARNWNPMETLFAFMGWLTCRRERSVFSSTDDASLAVELITAFGKRHGLDNVRDGWDKAIVAESALPEPPAPVTPEPQL